MNLRRTRRSAWPFKSFIAVNRYDRGRLTELRLYPFDLGYGGRLANRGTPRLAAPALGREMLENLQQLLAHYGTTIRVEDNVGVNLTQR